VCVSVDQYYLHIDDISCVAADFVIINKPTVETMSVHTITALSAITGGDVISDGGTDVIARGVCWSTSPEPIILDSKTTVGEGIGAFATAITGLQAYRLTQNIMCVRMLQIARELPMANKKNLLP